ncbi:MAG: hypothetical protein DMG90_15730 [Acidobacteria bacterium]|jgi:hypothetical protein|nr:MAG: hypothetical protein DMG91_07280 [Acidobacteriota bacterium]PYV88104.1 MAG: hypothetical protein DMG90_15730 [Acidobacteriota bacterium]
MAKRRKKTGRTHKPADPAALRPVDLARVREQIECLVGNAAVDMVTKTIEDAKNGRYLGMRFLFEMTGIYPAIQAETAPSGGETLAQTLLERLGLLTPEELQDGSDSQRMAVAASSEHDAVE